MGQVFLEDDKDCGSDYSLGTCDRMGKVWRQFRASGVTVADTEGGEGSGEVELVGSCAW